MVTNMVCTEQLNGGLILREGIFMSRYTWQNFSSDTGDFVIEFISKVTSDAVPPTITVDG